MEDARDALKCAAERLTLGITRVLDSMPGVVDVRCVEREPAEKRCLLSWEQKNACLLPEDLKDFFLTTDGFTLTWGVKLESKCVPVGRMVINSVSNLRPLCQSSWVFSLPNAPTLADLDWEDNEESEDPDPPHFDSRSRIFELDSCGGNDKVCLVYKNCSKGMVGQQCEVWFLDRCLYWHYLTPSFTAYYRLMITHLGLPEWQYAFTPYGPSPQAKQWASFCQPLTFHGELSQAENIIDTPLNKLDPNRAFKAKAKPPALKKSSAQTGGMGGSAKSQGSSGRQSATKR